MSDEFFNYKLQLKNGYYCYLEPNLQFKIDTLIANVKKDWDFIIIISGNRETRTGKSVLALNICAYIGERLGTGYDIKKNLFFRAGDMMKSAKELPRHSVIHYDEGRESLAANKFASQLQKDMLDFFDRFAQKNHIWVIVLPDFFTLKEEVAVAKSEFLINVRRRNIKVLRDIYREGKMRPIERLERGYYNFYDRRKKEELFIKFMLTRRKSYDSVYANFGGRFTNNYPCDEMEYRKLKREDSEREIETEDSNKGKDSKFRDGLIYGLHKKGYKYSKISEWLLNRFNEELTPQTIGKIVRDIKKEEKELNVNY